MAQIQTYTPKTTPADSDVTIIADSEATNATKTLSWSSIKATLKSYFDTLYVGASNINSLIFDTTPTTTPTQGQLYWDANEGTLAVDLDTVNGVTQQIGTELYIKVVNKTGSTINDGQGVYINGAQGNRPTIALAQANNINTASVMGVATQNIANNAEGFITRSGDVIFNTSAFTAGDELFLSATTAGALTNVAPSYPNFAVKIATACNSTVNGRITVHPHQVIKPDIKYISFICVEKATSLAVGTNIIGSQLIPFTGTIVGVEAYVETAGTTGNTVIDINKNGTSIMATNKITIETTETSSRTATTQPAITTSAISNGDLITIDIDSVSSTAPKGLTVILAIVI